MEPYCRINLEGGSAVWLIRPPETIDYSVATFKELVEEDTEENSEMSRCLADWPELAEAVVISIYTYHNHQTQLFRDYN